MSNVVTPGVIEAPLITIGGSPLSAEQSVALFECRVESAVARPARATLRFLDPEYELVDASTFLIDSALTVKLANAAGELTEVFSGRVAGVGVEANADGDVVLVVTAYDGAFKIGRNSVAKVWAEVTYSDMVTQIARASGLGVSVPSLPVKFVHQLQVTDDAALLSMIATNTGRVWFVKGTTLTMVEPKAEGASAAELVMRQNLRSLRATTTASDVNQSVTVRAWDPSTKAAVEGQSGSAPTKLANSPATATTRTKAQSGFGSTRTTLVRPALSAQEAKEIAVALARRSAGDEMVIRGEADGNGALAVGAVVTVKGVGERLSGTYFLTKVEHVYNGRGFVTRFASGHMEPSTLVDLLGGSTQPAWHMRGPVIGLVSEVGKESFSGKVKVKLPVAGNSIVTDWARVASPVAGPKRGMFMVPSINDEVLVMFEDGDLRRAVVVGSLWNGKDSPPKPTELESGNPTEWRVNSPTGHQLVFHDPSDSTKQSLELLHNNGTTKLVLSAERVELWGVSGKPVQVKAGDTSITFSDKGDITIKGAKISIEAQSDLELKGVNVKVTAQAGLTLKATGTAELSGATVAVKGQSMTEVKGGMVKIN